MPVVACLCVSQSVGLRVCAFLCLCICVYPFVCPSVYPSVHLSVCLTVLDVLPEDPELGVVLKGDEAALFGGTDLFTNHNKASHQPMNTVSVCVCMYVC